MRRVCVVAAVLALLASGCTTSRRGTPVVSRETPRGLSLLLVPAAAVTALPGAPAGLVRQKIDQAGLTVDPDPRAPCGAVVDNAPSLQQGALAVFANPVTNTVVTQWVNRLPGRQAATLIGADIADARPGCENYISLTDTGANQLNHLIRVVKLPPSLADQRLATVLKLTPVRGTPEFAASIELRSGACLMRVIVISPERVPTKFVRALAVLTGKRLDSGLSAC
jgi:hypothetical protein